MNGPKLHALTLIAAADAIAAGTLTARALAEAELARVGATDPSIEAWAHLDPHYVHAEAYRCDAAPRIRRGPLHGIGIGVKDIVATADQPTQMGSPDDSWRRFSRMVRAAMFSARR